eukprot:6074244-Prymnesium_polylepis.2
MVLFCSSLRSLALLLKALIQITVRRDRRRAGPTGLWKDTGTGQLGLTIRPPEGAYCGGPRTPLPYPLPPDQWAAQLAVRPRTRVVVTARSTLRVSRGPHPSLLHCCYSCIVACWNSNIRVTIRRTANVLHLHSFGSLQVLELLTREPSAVT